MIISRKKSKKALMSLMRFTSLFLALTVFITVFTSAYADGMKEYYVEEADMEISLPDNWIVFTRDTENNNPYLSLFGLSYDSYMEYIKEAYIYIDAINLESFHETIVIITELNTKLSFHDLSDTVLNAFNPAMADLLEQMGYSILNSEVYSPGQLKFLKYHFSNENELGMEYYTVYEGKAVTITTHAYDKSISAEEETLLDCIADSVTFGKELPKSDVMQMETKELTEEDFYITEDNTTKKASSELLTSSKQEFKTARGITNGDSTEAVEAAYGTPDKSYIATKENYPCKLVIALFPINGSSPDEVVNEIEGCRVYAYCYNGGILPKWLCFIFDRNDCVQRIGVTSTVN